MQEETPTRDDLRLIDALQVWPRAPWARLGPVLGADPVTLARRWARLSERGMAWVTVQPSEQGSWGGFLEVECSGGAIEGVVAALEKDGECLSIDVTSGARDLLLTVGTTSTGAFGRYAVERVSTLPGVRAVRTHPVIRAVASATQWRLRALDDAQVRAVDAARQASVVVRSAAPPDPEVRRLLTIDGRVTSREVARALDVPVRRARDLLASTLAADGLRLRTDMPRWASGWPVAAWYFVRVPAARLSEVGTRLRGLRAVRAVMSVAGPANVLINVWLRDLAEVEHLEEVMELQLPDVSVLDRSLVLAVRKRMGCVFDADEMPQGVVPGVEVAPGTPTVRSRAPRSALYDA